jgi:hypothetical protein
MARLGVFDCQRHLRKVVIQFTIQLNEDSTMSQTVIVHGRYVDHAFIPDEQLPDVEGTAQLVITHTEPSQASIFDLFGKASHLRSAEDIAAQVQEERNEWGEP